MTDFNHGVFVRVLREGLGGKLPNEIYGPVLAAVEAGLGKPQAAPVPPIANSDPAWLREARTHLGKSEVPGAKHSPFVLSLWKALGRPYKDDETPWCGGFVGYCMAQAGHEGPKIPERASAWGDWGKACAPVPGAVAVFTRAGGGHVGFLVGQSDASWYVLGGNQSNQVNIMPIDKARLSATRWPAGVGVPLVALPRMSGGVVSRNEA